MQPLYRPSQYRNTAVHQPGRAPHVNLPTPDFSAPAQAAAAMVDHADALNNTITDEIEYTSSLAEEDRIANLTTNALAEYTRRSNLPDGVDGSWYDERGIFRENEYKEWESTILSQLNTSSAAGFIRPESKQRAVAASLDARNKLRTQLTARQAADIPAHARRRLETSYQNHLTRGDYPGAIQIASNAPDWVVNPEDRAHLIHTATQKANIQQAASAAATGNPADFLRLYDNPDFINSCDPATLLRINQLIPRITPQNPTSTITRNKDNSVSYAKEFPRLPYAVPDYIYDHYTQSGGQPAFKADPALRLDAHNLLTRFAAESITSADSPEPIERFKTVANLYGYDDSAANAILKPLLDRLTKANEYDPAKTSARLVTWRNYATPDQRAELVTIDRTIHTLTDQWNTLPPDADESDRVDLQTALSVARTELNELANEIKHSEQEAETLALATYTTWRGNNPQATKAECITKYYDILDSYTYSEHQDLLPYQQEIRAAQQADDQLAATRITYGAHLSPEEYQLNTATVDAARRTDASDADSPFLLECSAATTHHLPGSAEAPIIYLPADSTVTRDSITVHNGKISIPAQIVKTDQVSTAMLSGNLRLQLGILGLSGYNTICFSNSSANLTHTPRANTIADTIFNQEARRDQNGNLAIYNPPAADGGGEYEIAGINTIHHPQKAARLKYLIETGQHQQAEQEAKNYYIHYTQQAADHLTTQHIKSPAAELMLRDIYFNMGPGGMQNVLHRAFGNQPIATYLRTHNEQDLLQRIYTARNGYYEHIIQNNPGKAIFRKGWYNRSTKILSTALSLVK